MASKICPICGEEIIEGLFDIHVYREKRALKELEEDHPEWKGDTAAFARMLQEYKRRHEEFRNEAHRLRLSTDGPFKSELDKEEIEDEFNLGF